MRRFLRNVSLMLLIGAFACPAVEAQRNEGATVSSRGRNSNKGNAVASPSSPANSRPSNSASANRPGNNNNRPGNGSMGPSQNNRPAQQPANRPGQNNNRPNQRPGNNSNHGFNGGHDQGYRPGQNFNPGPAHRPGHNPGPAHRPGPIAGVHFGAPSRPMMPPPRPWIRPVPPPHFRPAPHGPSIATILGVALGTTINYAINNLVNSGYNVTGYGNDVVYISNAQQLGMLWPNATLYYTNGGLAASEFVYSTPYYNMNRYNMAYSQLFANYGAPYSTEYLPGGGTRATWWGANGHFVTLQFMPENAINGTYRYYTTLSFGN